MSGPSRFYRVESNQVAVYTPGGVLPPECFLVLSLHLVNFTPFLSVSTPHKLSAPNTQPWAAQLCMDHPPPPTPIVTHTRQMVVLWWSYVISDQVRLIRQQLSVIVETDRITKTRENMWDHVVDLLFLCYVFLFIIPKFIFGPFLVYLSIFLTLEQFMYFPPLIIGSNISSGCLSIYDLLTMESVDYVSLISFTPGIPISYWSSWICASCSSLTGL